MTPGPRRSAGREDPAGSDVPPGLRARIEEIVALTDAFAAEHLDEEYAALCRRMALELARLRPSPLERGEARTWAATILHTVGWINFLGDPSRVPHMSPADLAARTGVGQSTIALRSREVRDALDLVRMDPAWTPPSRLGDNPMAWMIMVDGLIVDARLAPRAIQEEAFRVGAIPYLPGAGPEPGGWYDASDEGDLPAEAVPQPAAGEHVAESLREVLAEAEAMVSDLLERNPDASDEELNAALLEMVERHNAEPQAEFGGLSPDDVRRLVEADWRSAGSVIRIADTLTLDELASSDLLHDARTVLLLLAERREVKATPKGNLPRAFVAAFRERMRPAVGLDEWWYAEHPPRNEEDLRVLHLARNLLEVAGLVKRRHGLYSRTRQGERLTAPERAGELFALLLRTHFREMNLAWLDGLPDASAFQQTIGYALHQFARAEAEWRKARELVDALLLPVVRDELPPRPYADDAALMLETRFLRPLVRLGLAETRQNEREAEEMLAQASYRRTALLARAVVFEMGRREG